MLSIDAVESEIFLQNLLQERKLSIPYFVWQPCILRFCHTLLSASVFSTQNKHILGKAFRILIFHFYIWFWFQIFCCFQLISMHCSLWLYALLVSVQVYIPYFHQIPYCICFVSCNFLLIFFICHNDNVWRCSLLLKFPTMDLIWGQSPLTISNVEIVFFLWPEKQCNLIWWGSCLNWCTLYWIIHFCRVSCYNMSPCLLSLWNMCHPFVMLSW